MTTLNEELAEIQNDMNRTFDNLATRIENIGSAVGEERDRLNDKIKAVENGEIRRILTSISSRLEALEQKLSEDDES